MKVHVIEYNLNSPGTENNKICEVLPFNFTIAEIKCSGWCDRTAGSFDIFFYARYEPGDNHAGNVFGSAIEANTGYWVFGGDYGGFLIQNNVPFCVGHDSNQIIRICNNICRIVYLES